MIYISMSTSANDCSYQEGRSHSVLTPSGSMTILSLTEEVLQVSIGVVYLGIYPGAIMSLVCLPQLWSVWVCLIVASTL